MIAIKPASAKQKLTPNLLPCAVRHDGPVPVAKRYWEPEIREDGQTVYFRGRKLEGTEVKLPEGYEGVVLQPSEERLIVRPQLDAEEEPEEVVETKLFSQLASFDSVIVWDYEAIPQADDAYVKGINEWVKFAEVIHAPESTTGPS